MGRQTAFALAVMTALGWTFAARADAIEEFYRGRTITVTIPAETGGGYDLYARLMMRYLGHYIPGDPSFITKYMPGSGGIKAANYMYNVAPKDGSEISIPLASIVVAQLIQPDRVRFDAAKFSWIGTIAELNTVVSVWHGQGVSNLDDAKKHEIALGGTGKGSFLFQQPMLLNALLGTKFKVVLGYKGTADLDIAIERGEVGGRAQFWASWKANRPDWLSQGKLVHVVQVGRTKIPELSNVPSFADLVKTDRERSMIDFLYINTAMGRTLSAPPDIPAERLAALRKGVDGLVKDAAFLAEMDKRKLPVSPASGEELAAFVKRVLATPPAVVAELQKTLGLK